MGFRKIIFKKTRDEGMEGDMWPLYCMPKVAMQLEVHEGEPRWSDDGRCEG